MLTQDGNIHFHHQNKKNLIGCLDSKLCTLPIWVLSMIWASLRHLLLSYPSSLLKFGMYGTNKDGIKLSQTTNFSSQIIF